MRAVVTGGTIAGIIISNQILGNQHPWSDVRPTSRHDIDLSYEKLWQLC